jgi:hypothetical protein
MFDYFTKEKLKDKTLRDAAKENPAIMLDMVTMLQGDRRGFTDEDIEEMDDDDIIDEVYEHMRFGAQGAGNVFTVAKDLSHMRNEQVPQAQRDSFSRLYEAFENQGRKEGFFDAVGDYALATVSDPTTAASVGAGILTGGTGTAAIQAAKIGGQRALLKKLVRSTLLKNSLINAGVEGTIGLGAGHLAEEVKEETKKNVGEDYDYSLGNVLTRGALSAGLGGAITYGTGSLKNVGFGFNPSVDKTLKMLEEGEAAKGARLKSAEDAAEFTLKKANSDKTPNDKATLEAITNKLKALDRTHVGLDPVRVKKGMQTPPKDLSSLILNPTVNSVDAVVGGFDVSTLKRIAAAGVELAQGLGRYEEGGELIASKTVKYKSEGVFEIVDPEMTIRLTDKLANAFEKDALADRPTSIALDLVESIKDKYKLSNSQFSALFAAEFSEAGKKLNVASQIARSDRRKALEKLYESTLNLSEYGVHVPLTKEELAELKRLKELTTSWDKTWGFLRSVEDTRIGLMTSQVATTMRNTFFGGIYVAMDAGEAIMARSIAKATGNPTAGAIVKPSLSVINRLVFNRTESEAAIAMLEKEFPKELANLFNKRGMIESETAKLAMDKRGYVGNKFINFATKMNVLNSFSDMQFKRAVLLGNLDRRLGTASNAEEVGSSIAEVMRRGTWDKVDKRVFDKSVDEAYNKSFQTQFGLKGESALSKGTKTGIDLMKRSIVGTLVLPFPRFVASQAKFINDYIPFSFLYKGITQGKEVYIDKTTGKLVKKSATGTTMEEDIAKSITGVVAFAAGINLAATKAKDGYNFNELETFDGSTANVQALLGPLALHAYAGDIFYRWWNGMNLPKMKEMNKQVTKLLVGTDLRAQGPIGNVVESIYRQDADYFFKAMADLGASATYPAAVLKDVYGQLDPRSAALPETRDAQVMIFDLFGGLTELDRASFQRATRFLPDVPFMKGAPLIGTDKTARQEMLDEDKADRYDPYRYDPFTTHPLYLKDPFISKQLQGAEKQPKKSLLQREMSRLQINTYEAYRTYGVKNPYLDIMTRMHMSSYVPKKYEQIIQSPLYRNMTDSEKREELLDALKAEASFTRENARKYFDAAENKGDEDILFYMRGEYKDKIKSIDIDRINGLFEERTGEKANIEEQLKEARMNNDEAVELSLLMNILEIKKLYDKGSRAFTKAIVEDYDGKFGEQEIDLGPDQ